jgi:MFS family permease
MTTGLTLVALALFLLTGITTHSGYGLLLVSFLAMGAGMGLVMSPMSTAAMNSVEPTKAGVASGILSMTRMVGGTFGVALMGAIIATLGRSHLQTLLPGLPASDRAHIVSSLGSGAVPHGVPENVIQAGRETFVYALSNTLYVAAAVALLGALLAWVLIEARSTEQKPTAPQSASEFSGSEAVHVSA